METNQLPKEIKKIIQKTKLIRKLVALDYYFDLKQMQKHILEIPDPFTLIERLLEIARTYKAEGSFSAAFQMFELALHVVSSVLTDYISLLMQLKFLSVSLNEKAVNIKNFSTLDLTLSESKL